MASGVKPVLRRIVSKDGRNMVRIDNVEGMVKLYLHDLWTTVVDMKWRYKLTLFSSTFILTWFLFGVLFYLIGLGNGDMEPGLSENYTRCVQNVYTLTGAFLFSMESQTTIGYGYRYISEECPLAVFTLVAQLVITGLAEIFVTGAFLASCSARWRWCASTGGQRCLMVRVANMRKSLLIQCQLTGKLLCANVTEEGEKTRVHQTSVDFFMDSSGECPFLIFPLSHLSAETLQTSDFELLITLNATMESTAATCQSRTSYVPGEILWGHEFQPVLFSTGADTGRYIADFSFFDKVQVSSSESAKCNDRLLLLALY
uniref:Potassium inwardly rectifying channel subfamily J member 15 n=1 Tax=Neogobius melanostomus TaxID=47308 RepID=A0A8C6SDR3_9GOBI